LQTKYPKASHRRLPPEEEIEDVDARPQANIPPKNPKHVRVLEPSDNETVPPTASHKKAAGPSTSTKPKTGYQSPMDVDTDNEDTRRKAETKSKKKAKVVNSSSDDDDNPRTRPKKSKRQRKSKVVDSSSDDQVSERGKPDRKVSPSSLDSDIEEIQNPKPEQSPEEELGE
jgi:hypothetical protein